MISLMQILLNEAAGPTDSIIIDAVTNKRVIALYYKGDKETSPGWRIGIVPVCFGITNGKKYLRAWQTSGKTLSEVPEWKLFRVDRIRNWNVVGNKTATDVPDDRFNPNGDKQIRNVLAIAKF